MNKKTTSQTSELTARVFQCARCRMRVFICSHCDRGNIYCGSICSRAARQQSLCAAGQRYQKSILGRQKHAQRQQRYRRRKSEETKKVTHQGSPQNPDHDVLPLVPTQQKPIPKGVVQCSFCSRSMVLHLRSGFLRRYTRREPTQTSALPLGP